MGEMGVIRSGGKFLLLMLKLVIFTLRSNISFYYKYAVCLH